MKLKNRLLLSNNLVVIITMIIIFFILFFQVRNVISDNVYSELSKVSESSKNLVETYVNASIKNHLFTVADQSFKYVEYEYQKFQKGIISEEKAWQNVRDLILDSNYAKIGETGYLAGVDGKGKLVIHPKSEGVLVKADFMKKATQMKNGYLEYEWQNKGETKPRNKVAGLKYFKPWDLIVWASSYKSEFYDLVDINELNSKLKKIKFGTTGYMYIINMKGSIISHPYLKVGKDMTTQKDTKGKYFVKEIINNIKEQKEDKTKEIKGDFLTYYWANNENSKPKKKLVYFTYIPEREWIVVSGSYINEFYAPLTQIIYMFLISGLVATLIIFIVIVILSKNVATPLVNLSSHVKLIQEGKLQKLENTEYSIDEISLLANSFNLLISKFQNVYDELQNITKDLFNISKSNKNIVLELSDESSNQAATIEQISAITEQSASTLSKISNDAKTTQTTTNTNIDKIRKNFKSFEQIEEKVNYINEKSEEIKKSMILINDIAEQTNMLALNASIEATKAHEYGKGFSVVASEIRNLSEQTQNTAQQINKLIKEDDNIVKQTEKYIHDSKESFQQVLSDSINSNNIISEIFSEISMQSENISEISNSIDTFTESSQIMVNTVDTIKDNSTTISTIVNTLDKISNQFEIIENIIKKESEKNKERNKEIE